ncbi:hypothetical protein LDENG_00167020 [Lucifuga dentata]|nr:hypothetical protein LDENG_00167020 [Lucifuga dentata]
MQQKMCRTMRIFHFIEESVFNLLFPETEKLFPRVFRMTLMLCALCLTQPSQTHQGLPVRFHR